VSYLTPTLWGQCFCPSLAPFQAALSRELSCWTVRSRLGFARFSNRKIDDQLAELVGVAGPFWVLDHAPIMADGLGNSKTAPSVLSRGVTKIKLMHYRIFRLREAMVLALPSPEKCASVSKNKTLGSRGRPNGILVREFPAIGRAAQP
jgi:hypothetical protein